MFYAAASTLTAHRELGRKIAAMALTHFFGFGAAMEEAVRAASGGRVEARHFGEMKALAGALREMLGAGTVVLLKGSRSMKMEEILPLLDDGSRPLPENRPVRARKKSQGPADRRRPVPGR